MSSPIYERHYTRDPSESLSLPYASWNGPTSHGLGELGQNHTGIVVKIHHLMLHA